MKTIEKIQIAISKSKLEISKASTLEERYESLANHLCMQNLRFDLVGEKPAKGANLSVITMKGKYRVNYRCGYGRNNYAPCVEILNEVL